MGRTTMDISDLTALYPVPEEELLERLVKACCKECDHAAFTRQSAAEETMGADHLHEPKGHHERLLWNLFRELVQERSKGKFLQLRELIIESGNYTPYAGMIENMERCLIMDGFPQAIDLYNSSWPNCLLSPRAHLLLSRIFNIQGDADQHKSEEALAFTVLDLILKSGDGTKNSPYNVLHLADKTDVLVALEKNKVGEELIECNGRYLDCVMTDDEQEIYFDVTDMILRGQDLDDDLDQQIAI
ncbi:hypothetical protein D3OALGB2SA_3629 [Olavius algarvensis associated proteobacterium Delta 3]|nr:hypothetical protein D3OALGB2SA_3629 [Olavius algarvensis associated proteobacterium Delta 3]